MVNKEVPVPVNIDSYSTQEEIKNYYKATKENNELFQKRLLEAREQLQKDIDGFVSRKTAEMRDNLDEYKNGNGQEKFTNAIGNFGELLHAVHDNVSHTIPVPPGYVSNDGSNRSRLPMYDDEHGYFWDNPDEDFSTNSTLCDMARERTKDHVGNLVEAARSAGIDLCE